MTTRAIWKGLIQLGESSIPVKLFAAIEDKGLHFRLLHARDRTPVQQEMVHPETNRVMPKEAVRHGYETEDGRIVILTDQELQTLEPEPSRRIEILCCLPSAVIDHRWYDRPYFLGPDGDPEPYFALIAALDGAGTEALARWVMRGKEYCGILRLHERYPLLITLRHSEEVVALAELPIPTGRPIDRKELAMAEQLVTAMADNFDPRQYRDDYREQVVALIAAKASGKIVELRKPAPPETTTDLQEALAASLRAVRGRRHG